MIKFFRRIRQKLLSENKVSKYLLYAIGEIFLVVVGILIALSINNWNEKRITNEKEQHALLEIKSDLEHNINRLNYIISDPEEGIESIMETIDIVVFNLEESRVYNDSMAQHFIRLFNYPDIALKSSGYESLTSMGMDLISDHHLRSEIGILYTYQIPLVKLAFREVRDDFYHYMLDYLNGYFVSRLDENGRAIRLPVNYDELINNRQFIESLKNYKYVYDYFIRESKITLNECKALLQEIEKEIKVQ
ncbi:DUF6090 family protein [Muriicola sp. SD30]|uniref:DUF6090 family protein n=1 Tax=Muriicola sp. SD30 TaxID=3240936 RepID=UPI00350ED0CD